MGSVRHTAGRTLLAVMSSKGKRTRTILPLVMERFAIGGGVNVLGGILQEIEGGAGRDGLRPGSLGDVGFLRHEHNHPDAALSGNGQRLVQPQLMLCVHNPGSFDRVHDKINLAHRSQKTSFFTMPTQKGCLLYTSPSPRDRTRYRM